MTKALKFSKYIILTWHSAVLEDKAFQEKLRLLKNKKYFLKCKINQKEKYIFLKVLTNHNSRIFQTSHSQLSYNANL
jgi:hypothetical protein